MPGYSNSQREERHNPAVLYIQKKRPLQYKKGVCALYILPQLYTAVLSKMGPVHQIQWGTSLNKLFLITAGCSYHGTSLPMWGTA